MIEFFNVRTGEKRQVETEPMLAAFWNSSDQGANSHEGQDFGWRVSPPTLARMKAVKADRGLMDHIKSSFQLADDAKDIDILRWVSLEEARKQTESEQTQETDFTRQYEDEVRALDDQSPPRHVNRDAADGQFVSDQEVKDHPETTVTETVKSPKSNNTDSGKQADNAKIDASKTTKQEK